MSGAQQSLGLDVPRVAKRSTSRVVRRPIAEALVKTDEHRTAYRAVLDYCSHGVIGIGPYEAEALVDLVERAHGLSGGERDSFYVARVPPPENRSHLGDLNGPLGSRAAQRRDMLRAFLHGPETAREAGETFGDPKGWRRVSELVQGGYLEPTGETRETCPGHRARVLRITDRGRAALENA